MAGQIARLGAEWIPEGRLRERVENLATRRSALTTWLHAHTVFRHGRARRMAGLSPSQISQEEQFIAILAQDCDDWTRETQVGLSCLLDTRVYMISQLLRDSDASSMAHSLELRVPLVDLKLADFCRSCADEFKLHAGGGPNSQYYDSGSKRVLIHALRDVLPPSITSRPKKGFSMPYANWMRGALASIVEDTCSDETIKRRGLIDPALAASAHGRAQEGADLYPSLWSLMILELWCRAVLDRYQSPAVATAAAGF